MTPPLGARVLFTMVGAALLLAVPTSAAAQNDCGVDYALLWRAVAQGSPSETHFFTRVTVTCDDGTEIYADSAIVSPPQRLSQFFGNVTFNEEGRLLNADRATYRNDIDRLDAFGNVSLVDTAGSQLEGDNLVYLRSGEGPGDTHLTMTGVGGAQSRALIVPGRPSADSVAPDTVAVADTLVTDTLAIDSLAADTLAIDTLAIDPAAIDAVALVAVAEPDTLPPAPVEPYQVTADRIIIEGSDMFRGEGRVEVTRDALHATGRNMVYESARGEMVLVGDARSEGEGYALTAEAITVMLPDDKVEAVIARGGAELTTDDLDIAAPKIQIFVDAEKLERLVAAQLGPDDTPVVIQSPSPDQEGDTRATALTQDFLLLGDSLDVETPGEELERVIAVGRARGESFGQDTLNRPNTPELAQHDWLEGDTIVATFLSRAPDTIPAVPDAVVSVADSTDPLAAFQARPDSVPEPSPDAPPRERYELDRLVATGRAKSFYRMAPSDTTGTIEAGRFALHYVVGDGITIVMLDGEADRMEVSGQTQGFHLEPVPISAVADSSAADAFGLDSLTVDTLAVPPIPEDTMAIDTMAIDTLPVDTASIDTLAFNSRNGGRHAPLGEPPAAPVRGQSPALGVKAQLTLWSEPTSGLANRAPHRPSRRTFWPTH